MGFNPHWGYKNYDKYINQKVVNLSRINNTHLKADIFHGSVVNGIREPMLFSFVVDKTSGYKIFCQPETIHYKK